MVSLSFKEIKMPDITICTNNECGLQDYCWRFCCPPQKFHQSYQRFEFETDDEGEMTKCDYFIPFPDEEKSDLVKLFG